MFSISNRYIFILALSVYSYVNILVTVGTRLFDFTIPQTYVFGVIALLILGIWELNRMVERNLHKLTAATGKRIHPLIILFAISMLNVVLVSLVSIEILYVFLKIPIQLNSNHFTLLMALGFRVNLFLNCVNAIVYYMNQLKKTQLEAEQLKKITIEAQFEALRNQINPHFLFNCFNVLSTLVYKDADTSAKFISQLSHVYRYLLYNQEKKIVSLKDELTFINAYVYLLSIRFGENIIIKNEITADQEKYYVAPAVLQMLIENAIKHNIVSKKFPLQISLYNDGHSIVVSNSLQEKDIKEESTQVGLNNIIQRYKFLSDYPVLIERTNDEFKVSIPLLQLTKSEYSYR